jgi:biopolymer transport protein ExbD
VNLNENVLSDIDDKLQIAPLIDVVFLLLIYFILTTALVKKEGDIPFFLPADIPPEEQVKIPVEMMIQIEPNGTVLLEDMQFSKDDVMLSELVGQIRAQQQMALNQDVPFFVNIAPHRDALHTRVINVMNACHEADVKSLAFSKSM